VALLSPLINLTCVRGDTPFFYHYLLRRCLLSRANRRVHRRALLFRSSAVTYLLRLISVLPYCTPGFGPSALTAARNKVLRLPLRLQLFYTRRCDDALEFAIAFVSHHGA
jgi:hypothetical protein